MPATLQEPRPVALPVTIPPFPAVSGRLPEASGRRVALLSVHHTRVDGQTLTGGAEEYILMAVEALLAAFARLVGDGEAGAQLTYFGDGPLVPLLRDRATELGLGRFVHFAGYIADRSAIYRDLDVLVVLSRRESMSNSVLEAMARGIPCIASEVGGLPEVVEDGWTGLLVPAEDVEAAAHAMRRLLDGGIRSDMGRESHRLIEGLFNLDSIRLRTVRTILGV